MTRRVREIEERDSNALSDFLDRHSDTTLFLRGNLADAGLRNPTHPFGGTWIGAFDADDALRAVAAHFNGGNIVVGGEAAGAGDVARAARLAVEVSARPVRGVVGPWDLARAALDGLALDAAPGLESREVLYRLEIERIVVPDSLATGRVSCRRSREPELDALAAWRVAFEVESLAKTPTPQLRVMAHQSVTRAHDLGRLFVLEDDAGVAVASSAFNAWADGIAQVGGVFTPPEHRRRGHGRAVVAGSLADAQASGVHRSVLFTRQENVAARRAYEALGFEEVGDYGLLLF